MAFNPKEERFLHMLPPKVPGVKLPGAPAVKPAVVPVSGAVPIAQPAAVRVTPGVVPVPGQKHVGPSPGRWNRLQEYLNKPTSPVTPVAPPKEEAEE